MKNDFEKRLQRRGPNTAGKQLAELFQYLLDTVLTCPIDRATILRVEQDLMNTAERLGMALRPDPVVTDETPVNVTSPVDEAQGHVVAETTSDPVVTDETPGND